MKDSEHKNAPIETRVKQSLHRLGYDKLQVTHVGDGHIVLTCDVTPPDRSVVTAAGTVPGVTKVTFNVK